MTVPIDFYRHGLGQAEKDSVCRCLDGLFLTTGQYVRDLETKLAEYLGIPHVVGLTSCTAALHLSLLALDIGPGDEVITTPMTFIATATSIMHTGARPIFVDVEPSTGLIDIDAVARAITDRTRAILPVHLYGTLCDMRRLRRLADQHGLAIVEDCAHALEGNRDGIRPGELGDVACFSFYATKSITSGEGGAVATARPELAERIRLLRQHGMSAEAADRYSGNYKHWNMLACGWKYNMDNIQAALLLPQLPKIESRWKARQEVSRAYDERLKSLPLRTPAIPAECTSARHLYTIWVEPSRRDNVLAEMGRQGIGVAVNYRAIHLLDFFRSAGTFKPGAFPEAERIGDSTLSLPLWPGMTEEMVETVTSTLGLILAGRSNGA